MTGLATQILTKAGMPDDQACEFLAVVPVQGPSTASHPRMR